MIQVPFKVLKISIIALSVVSIGVTFSEVKKMNDLEKSSPFNSFGQLK